MLRRIIAGLAVGAAATVAVAAPASAGVDFYPQFQKISCATTGDTIPSAAVSAVLSELDIANKVIKVGSACFIRLNPYQSRVLGSFFAAGDTVRANEYRKAIIECAQHNTYVEANWVC